MCVYMKCLIMLTRGPICHDIDFVTPRYYNRFFVSQACHMKEVGLYTYYS